MFGNRGERRPYEPTPVKRIELSGEKVGLRFALFLVLLVIGFAAIGYGLSALVSSEAGWRPIAVNSNAYDHFGADFTLNYRLERGSATATSRAVMSAYTEAQRSAFAAFHPSIQTEGVAGLAYLNAHPNEELTLDATLYAALETLERNAATELLFLAPIYAEYESIFRSVTDEEAAAADPRRSEEARTFTNAVLLFLEDGGLDLELLGDGRARLHVSAAYARFAEANGIGTYLDFYWLRNAFVADHVAECLRAGGFTDCVFTSTDGFTVSLAADSGAVLHVLDRGREAGQLPLDRPLCAAAFRSYPLGESTEDSYYVYSDGETRTPYVSTVDGLDRTAADDLLLWSESRSCAELAILAARGYVGDAMTFEPSPDVTMLYMADGKLVSTALQEVAS